MEGKFKFENIAGTIDNPEIKIHSVTDVVKDKHCNVELRLTSNGVEFAVNLYGFTYIDTWEDSDVYDWALAQLETYLVTPKN